MFGKKQVAKLAAEFIGAGVLTLAVVGVQHSTIGVPYFVGIAAALAAAMVVLTVGSVSGAVLNPALTVALWSVRQLRTVTAVGYLVAQLLGAWAAYYLFTYLTGAPLNPAATDFDTKIMVAEAAGAAILAFGWAAAVYGKYTIGLKATVVAFGYVIGILVASAASVGLINPGVALADRAWTVFGSTGWGTYVLGPVLGALIGVNLYAWLFTDEMSLKKLGLGAAPAKAAAPAVATKPAAKKPAAKATAKKKSTAKKK